jgi:hypothetical protein
MIIISIILSFVALAYLCWLLFVLAVYALPLSLVLPWRLSRTTTVQDRWQRSSSARSRAVSPSLPRALPSQRFARHSPAH